MTGRPHREVILDALIADHLGVPVQRNLARAVTEGAYCGLAVHQPEYLADNSDRSPLWWVGDREDARRRARAPYEGPGSLGGKLDYDVTAREDAQCRLMLADLRNGPVAVLKHYAETLKVDLLNLTPAQREDLETACRRGIMTGYRRNEPLFHFLTRKQLGQALAWFEYEREHGDPGDPMKVAQVTHGLLAITRMRGDTAWL
ncbi:hypothetical protein OG470_15705 [Micromonospora sp. NBC_00389]|uniref:hypothetical protein n=1 Tax=Micromonospora sp. NBC_00389 TaxID=2903586 RepID=UPI002E1BB8AD